MPPKDSTYETESKVDMAKLREAARKVFAYDPSASQKDTVDTRVVKHRKTARKGKERSAHS